LAIFALVFGWTALMTAGTAGADTYVPATLSADHVAYNETITVSAGGFKPNTAVDGVRGNERFASGVANGSGSVSFTIAGNFPGSGTYRVRLQGLDNASGQARVASAVYTRLPCPPSTPLCFNGSGLARTGLAPLPLVLGGALAIAVGSALVIRRRQPGNDGMVAGLAVLGLTVIVSSLVPVAAHAQTTSSSSTSTTAAPGSISGKASEQGSGDALQDVCVHASSQSTFGSARTAADGTYTINNLRPGPVVVVFADCNNPATHKNANTSANVLSGQNTANVNGALANGAVMAGRVADAGSAAPLDHVCVLTGATADTLEACTAMTGASGVYSSDIMNPGTYIVGFVEFGGSHASVYLGGVANAKASTTLILDPGAAKSVNIGLRAAATISGRVTDAATGGNPRRAVCVYVRNDDLRTLASGFIFGSDTGGNYSIGQILPDTDKVEFTDCGFEQGPKYITEFYDDKPTVAAADPIALTAGQTRSGTDAALLREGDTPQATTTSSPTTTTVAGGAGTTTTVVSVGGTSLGTAALSVTTVFPGSQMSASGNGFAPGSEVVGFVLSTPIEVARGIADASGAITLTFTVPGSLEAGAHTVELRGVDPSGRVRVVSAPFTVIGSPVSPSGGALSRTGANTRAMVMVAGALIFFGSLLLRTTRRRRAMTGLWPEL
jgi:hypothetical protein